MDGDTLGHRAEILETLIRQSNLKQQVFDNTFAAFGQLKECLLEMASEFDDELEGKLDKRVRIEYRDRGKYEAQIQIAGEMLIFMMHTNVFDFDASHPVSSVPYVRDDHSRSYCGMIKIYNFLSDSFRYNRNGDEGYLIGRLFINTDKSFFVEGKNQERYNFRHFGAARIDREAIIDILESAIEYALDFDLFVPPYSSVKTATVEQFNTKMEISKFPTGKRMGFDFDVDETIPEIRKEKSGNPDENF